jgi:GGDEF domain-containing protein
MGKVSSLAREHQLKSVVVGMAGVEGDLLYPEVVSFVEATLRIEDSIVRLTRERSVLFLTDTDLSGAQTIMERVLVDFREHFPSMSEPSITVHYYEIAPGGPSATVKDVLPTLFSPSTLTH